MRTAVARLPQKHFLKYFFHSAAPYRAAKSFEKISKNVAFFSFEANNAASINCTFFRIIAHYAIICVVAADNLWDAILNI